MPIAVYFLVQPQPKSDKVFFPIGDIVILNTSQTPGDHFH